MNTISLEQMKSVDIRTVDPNDLIDITEVIVCHDKPQDERKKDFVKRIRNPYCFRVGKTIVKLSFDEGGDTMTDLLESMMMKL